MGHKEDKSDLVEKMKLGPEWEAREAGDAGEKIKVKCTAVSRRGQASPRSTPPSTRGLQLSFSSVKPKPDPAYIHICSGELGLGLCLKKERKSWNLLSPSPTGKYGSS